MKLKFQFKHIDGQTIVIAGGMSISKDKINIRFQDGPNIFWRNQKVYRKITRKVG